MKYLASGGYATGDGLELSLDFPTDTHVVRYARPARQEKVPCLAPLVVSPEEKAALTAAANRVVACKPPPSRDFDRPTRAWLVKTAEGTRVDECDAPTSRDLYQVVSRLTVMARAACNVPSYLMTNP